MTMATKEARIYSLVEMAGRCVVALEEVDGPRLVLVWIGVFEASAIAAALAGQAPPRPMTHDLMHDLVESLNAKVEKIVIDDLRGNTYYATIHMARNGARLEVDARPSDALALALRSACPIFVDEKVFDKCPEILKPISKEEAEKLKDELKTLSPEDFFKQKPSLKEPDEQTGAEPPEEPK